MMRLQGMYWLSAAGEDILVAQRIFMGLYVSLVMMVLFIYHRAGGRTMPLWSILLVCASRRWATPEHDFYTLYRDDEAVVLFALSK